MNHKLKNIIAIVLVSACSTAVAQAATTHQYLTTDQYVQQAKTRIIQNWSPKLNQSISATNAYYLALDKAIAIASKSVYKKNSNKYSEIDYLCANSVMIIPSIIDRSNYGIESSYICKNHFQAALALANTY